MAKSVQIPSARARGRRHRARLCRLLAFASVGALATAASASADVLQAPAAAPKTVSSSPYGATVGEVVVTAQKRAQDIQSVPISITALSGAQLDAQKVAGFEDLSRVAPGLAFDTSAEVGTTNISLRGFSCTAAAATGGLYLDDVSITTKNFFYEGAVDPVLPDLARIEVLRGPQGTLYGDSSEGGTIRYVANAPNMMTYSADLTVDTSHTAHGGENYAGAFALNLPIVPDVFALRISGSSETDSGWIDHYTQALAPDNSVVGGGVLDKKGVNSQRF